MPRVVVCAGLVVIAVTVCARFSFHAQGDQPAVGDPAIAAAALQNLGRPVPPNLNQLVGDGERLFFTETFLGNGRTCGSCHPATNNFTLDPAFIATLPNNDPLFVHEFIPALADLEDAALLRAHALIKEDGVDGFGPIQVLRGVPHTLSIGKTLSSGRAVPPLDALGWGGDGGSSDNNGQLRDFSLGAVRQHFTLTLNRVEGVDFVLPTDAELDALEMFMLSLGRSEDPDLTAIRMLDKQAEIGRVQFLSEDSVFGTQKAGKCNLCHLNGGANSKLQPLPGFNQNFDTSVQLSPFALPLPMDDGFGSPGDGTFNTPPLIEAADTPPWFHNSLDVPTLELAIDFYKGTQFANSPAGDLLRNLDTGHLIFPGLDVEAMAAFLRVLNACFANIDVAMRYQQRAKSAPRDIAFIMLDVAAADLQDAIEVLQQDRLHPDAVRKLEIALMWTMLAGAKDSKTRRNQYIDRAIQAEISARKAMIQEL